MRTQGIAETILKNNKRILSTVGMGTIIRKGFQGILKKAEFLLYKERNPGDPPMTSVILSILILNMFQTVTERITSERFGVFG